MRPSSVSRNWVKCTDGLLYVQGDVDVREGDVVVSFSEDNEPLKADVLKEGDNIEMVMGRVVMKGYEYPPK